MADDDWHSDDDDDKGGLGRDVVNSLHFGGGMVFNYKIGSKVKLKSDGGKEKFHNNYNLRPVEFDVRAQVGYANLNLFATYSLESLFKDNRGPQLNPVSF